MNEIRQNPLSENPLLREFQTSQGEQDQIFKNLLEHRLEVASRLAILKEMVVMQLGRPLRPGDLEDFAVFLAKERGVYISDRNYKDIATDHGMSNYQLAKLVEGRTVLDVGAGHSTFAQEIKDKGYQSQIVSIDLSEEALKFIPGLKAIAAAQALPFKNEQFDAVLATCSVPLWNNSPEEVVQSTREMMRVTRKAGRILISPVIGFALRPPLAKDGSKIGIEMSLRGKVGRRDDDLRAHYILNLNEIAFISTLENIKNTGAGQIIFTKAGNEIPSLIIEKAA